MPKYTKNCYGITGTNGKTSVVHFLLQFKKDYYSGISSLGAKLTKKTNLPNEFLKYPLCFNYIDCLLNTSNSSGIENYILEVFSASLLKGKLDFIKFNGSAFTNLSQDHFIDHKTMDDYFLTKTKLFTKLTPKNNFKIINGDCPYGNRLLKILNYKNCLQFGANASFPYYHDEKYIYFDGVKFPKADLPFSEEFQIMNLLCAIGIANISGIKNSQIIDAIPKLTLPEGRLEKVTEYKGAKIFIDYAHNPDGLKNVLSACRKIAKNKIIVLVSIPSYDTTKRCFLIGKVANKYADIVIVTDNYNSNNSDITRKKILEGCKDAYEESDRKKAIEMGIKILSKGDLFLICGLGNEKKIVQKGKKIPFNEREIIKEIIKNIA